MSKRVPGSKIRRILVALDCSGQDKDALLVAARLAAMLRAELKGLFIQDPDLMRFADLPIATEVVSHSAIERAVDRTRLERDLEAQANRISQELAQLAEQLKVRWSFETIKGMLENELFAVASRADLLIVHRKTGRMLVAHDQLGTTALAIATKARRTVMIMEEHDSLDLPLFVLIEMPESGIKTLATALRLSRLNQHRIIVLVHANSLENFEALSREIDQWVQTKRRTVEISWLRKLEMPILSHRLWQEGGGVLVVMADSPFLERVTLAQLIQQLKLPLVLVR